MLLLDIGQAAILSCELCYCNYMWSHSCVFDGNPIESNKACYPITAIKLIIRISRPVGILILMNSPNVLVIEVIYSYSILVATNMSTQFGYLYYCLMFIYSQYISFINTIYCWHIVLTTGQIEPQWHTQMIVGWLSI